MDHRKGVLIWTIAQILAAQTAIMIVVGKDIFAYKVTKMESFYGPTTDKEGKLNPRANQ